MALHQLDYLNAMGIQFWQEKQPKTSHHPETTDNLTSLHTKAKQCTSCSLHKTRKQVVFGAGNPHADLMLITDAPGFYEDQTGEPFAGQAGELLNRMLHAIELDRNAAYLTTLLKCRLPDNRAPLTEEIHQCAGFLAQQIALIQPKVILVLGETAAQQLLKTQTPLHQLRETTHLYHTTTLLTTYHPAHLLLNPHDKRNAWHDLQRCRALLMS